MKSESRRGKCTYWIEKEVEKRKQREVGDENESRVKAEGEVNMRK